MGELSRRTKSRLVDEASKDCLERLGEDQKRWAGTLDALVSVRGGRVVDGDGVMEWIASWGKKTDKEPPR